MWLMRGGIVLALGAFGTLGWIGYQQMPKSVSASEVAPDETLVLDGETAELPTTNFVAREDGQQFSEPRKHRDQSQRRDRAASNPFSAESARPVQTADAGSEIAVSPFERPKAFARESAADREGPATAQSESANPFAAFANSRSATVETTTEVTFDPKSTRRKSPVRPNDDIVTLASNETTAASEPAAASQFTGQSEPATVDLSSLQPEPVAPIETQSPPPASDPFAAFATQPTERAGASTTVPGSFGAAAQSEPAAEVQWNSAPSSAVSQVQFQTEHPPAAAPGGFEAEAKPINGGSPFETTTAPALTRPAATEWSGFENQPAAVEPAAPKRGFSRPTYSPGVERASANNGFNAPQPVVPANDPRDEKLHVVQQGETYWSIARQHYGAGRYFQALAEYNKPRISDQQALKPGMKVLVPSANTLETRYGKLMQVSGHAKPAAKPKSGLQFNAQGQPFYIVGQGDTLGDIATRYLGKTLRSDEIFRLNQEQLPTPNSLKVGMILVMPMDAAESQAASSIPRSR